MGRIILRVAHFMKSDDFEKLKADMEAETNRRTLNDIKSGKGLSPIKMEESR